MTSPSSMASLSAAPAEKRVNVTRPSGDCVTIGAGAKVLGAIKIGEDSRIGANAVVVKEVPASAVAVGVPGQIISRDSPANGDNSVLPDLVGVSLQSLLTRVAKLEAEDGGSKPTASSGPPKPRCGTAKTSPSERVRH